MASTKEYRDFILEQLSEAPNITCQPMMGEFLLYSNNVLFGGIYDDRLLVKIVPENAKYGISTEVPYPGAKPMHLIEDVDDKAKLAKIINAAVK
ncbi:competence protein TfoX [Candidatus Saccharibacteria bacterium]|nr:competence protein TfoX [Candidatus Saccharibacteria bacterium]